MKILGKLMASKKHVKMLTRQNQLFFMHFLRKIIVPWRKISKNMYD